MIFLKSFVPRTLRLGIQYSLPKNSSIIYRRESECKLGLYPPDKRDCFDIRNVVLERGNQCHAHMIKCFLNTHYWPREPTVVGLWMALDSSYLEILTEKYAHSGDRMLAFENVPRTGQRKLIGVAICNKVYPWLSDELEEWAHYTDSRPERNRMYFCAHCIKAPNLFAKFKIDYIYEVEILGTAAEVTGHGIGMMLLRRCLLEAFDLRHPMTQVVSVSAYTSRICEKIGMTRVWSMPFSDYVDDHGLRVFYPRRPHQSVEIFVKPFDKKAAARGESKPDLND